MLIVIDVNIRFVSTLTAEDENQLAPGILQAISALAEMFPIRFAVKLETVDGRTYHVGSAVSPLTQLGQGAKSELGRGTQPYLRQES